MILHDFFHYIRKWWIDVWNFMTFLEECKGGHTRSKTPLSKWSLVSQCKRMCGLDMCLTSRSWVLRLVPLSLGRIVRFQLWYKMLVLQGLQLSSSSSSLKSEMKMEGPTSKPNSLKLDTFQGHTFFYQTLFRNWRFRTCVTADLCKNPHRAWLGGHVREGWQGWAKTCTLFFWLSGALLDLIGGFLAKRKRKRIPKGPKRGGPKKMNLTEPGIRATLDGGI